MRFCHVTAAFERDCCTVIPYFPREIGRSDVKCITTGVTYFAHAQWKIERLCAGETNCSQSRTLHNCSLFMGLAVGAIRIVRNVLTVSEVSQPYHLLKFNFEIKGKHQVHRKREVVEIAGLFLL